uniref:DNA polymerase kappa n=1 Tax=Astyanax mexicanus TaxID=7994 RepID=A0A8B9L8M9_ASTMX
MEPNASNAGSVSADQSVLLSRMALNDNKAGMEGLDRDKINKIILETSKGSRFYENELKKEQQVNQRIEKILQQKAKLTEQQIQNAQIEVEKLSAELERGRNLSRVIVHVDMDAFYAAVEMRDCPELKDKPMAVGSMSMLSTSNYYARRYGVRAAMPGFIAKKLCPNLVIVPLNFAKYRAVSEQVREVFADYDPHFLPMSLDEAYLDITDHLEQRQHWPESMRTYPINEGNSEGENKFTTEAETDTLSPVLFEDSPTASPTFPVPGGKGEVFGTSPEEAVREMRFRIEQKTSLTASAGIAPNMMLAKVCSDKNKPNGQYRIPPERQAVMDFIQDLPVRKVSGIGKVTEKMLAALGIVSCAQLAQQMAMLSLLFSDTSWHHFIQISLGLGSTHIERDSERKSMSTERTFAEMSDAEEQYSLCRDLCQDLAKDLQKEGLKGKTVTLKLKNVKFEVKTKAFTLQCAVCTEEEIFTAAKDLLKAEIDNVSPQPLRLRLMGVRVSSFVSADDKQPQQKSIVGFLKMGSDTSRSTPSEQEHHSVSMDEPCSTTEPHTSGFMRPANAESLQTCGESSSKTNTASRANESTHMDTQSSTKTNMEQCFTCPVCFKEIKTTDLTAFNQHIDECLKGSSALNDNRTSTDIDQDLDVQGKYLHIPDPMEQLDQPGSSHATATTNPNESRSLPPNEPHVLLKDSGSNALPQNSTHSDEVGIKTVNAEKVSTLTCPVCNQAQDTDDLTLFNHHVDMCLNQEVLLELRESVPPVSLGKARGECFSKNKIK